MHGKAGGRRSGWAAAGLVALGLAPGLPAQAQSAGEAPGRIGPVWDGRRHQPNPAEVEARERARGLRPEPRRSDQAETQDLDRLYRRLTGSDPEAAPADARAPDRR